VIYRRGLQLHAATGGAVGLSQYQWNLKTCCMQARKGNCGELWGTSKNNFHGVIIGAGWAPGLAINAGLLAKELLM
jgi:hypothetical protein